MEDTELNDRAWQSIMQNFSIDLVISVMCNEQDAYTVLTAYILKNLIPETRFSSCKVEKRNLGKAFSQQEMENSHHNEIICRKIKKAK